MIEFRHARLGARAEFVCAMRWQQPWVNDRVCNAAWRTELDGRDWFVVSLYSGREHHRAIGIEQCYEALYLAWYGRVDSETQE